MKAVRIRPMQGRNPEFDSNEKATADELGQPYLEEPFIDYPIGSIIEGPAAWRAIAHPGGHALPADDEAHEKLVNWISSNAETMQRFKRMYPKVEKYTDKEIAQMLKSADQKTKELAARIPHIKAWNETFLQKLALGEEKLPTPTQNVANANQAAANQAAATGTKPKNP